MLSAAVRSRNMTKFVIAFAVIFVVYWIGFAMGRMSK